ncbi:hypothetical protein VTO58DRAFT_101955 [Aureobasidium pullulans]
MSKGALKRYNHGCPKKYGGHGPCKHASKPRPHCSAHCYICELHPKWFSTPEEGCPSCNTETEMNEKRAREAAAAPAAAEARARVADEKWFGSKKGKKSAR